jgi:uncharacterized damage-inducible protein DinB
MKDFLSELFQFNHRTNEKLAVAFFEHEQELSENAFRLFSHILNAHDIWNSRISGTAPAFSVWHLHVARDMQKMDRINFENSLSILQNSDLNRRIDYRNTKGVPYNNSVRDVLFHVINHSTYHRGQIASEFRKSGLEPLVTDFVAYKRLAQKQGN